MFYLPLITKCLVEQVSCCPKNHMKQWQKSHRQILVLFFGGGGGEDFKLLIDECDLAQALLLMLDCTIGGRQSLLIRNGRLHRVCIGFAAWDGAHPAEIHYMRHHLVLT